MTRTSGSTCRPRSTRCTWSARQDGFDAIGSSVTGTPWVVLGQNRRVTWGETTTGFDVTDTYIEQLVPDASSPSGL